MPHTIQRTGRGTPLIGLGRLGRYRGYAEPAAGLRGGAPLRGSRAGGFGPVGVAANRRGEGLGKLLLTGTLQRLRAPGVDEAIVDGTDLLGF